MTLFPSYDNKMYDDVTVYITVGWWLELCSMFLSLDPIKGECCGVLQVYKTDRIAFPRRSPPFSSVSLVTKPFLSCSLYICSVWSYESAERLGNKCCFRSSWKWKPKHFGLIASTHQLFYVHYLQDLCGARGSVVIKALGYKPEGRVFETWWD
jgi:hypothetical protein